MSAESRDNSTATGDHDTPYTFGRPARTYVNEREYVRLVIVKSRLTSNATIDADTAAA